MSRMNKDTPHPVDIHVGNRIRERRIFLGMSQSALAVPIGIKFQQIQKYENALNRVSASRLFAIATTLHVPISYFFEGCERRRDPVEGLGHRMLMLAKYFAKLSPEKRDAVFNIVKILAKEE